MWVIKRLEPGTRHPKAIGSWCPDETRLHDGFHIESVECAAKANAAGITPQSARYLYDGNRYDFVCDAVVWEENPEWGEYAP